MKEYTDSGIACHTVNTAELQTVTSSSREGNTLGKMCEARRHLNDWGGRQVLLEGNPLYIHVH